MESTSIEKAITIYRDGYSPETLVGVINNYLEKIWNVSEKDSEVDEWSENIFAAFKVYQEKTNPYKESPEVHLERFLNIMGKGDSRAIFLRDMRQMHRILQQYLVGHIFAWLNEYAKEYTVDDRNKASIEAVRTLVEAYKTVTGDTELPTRFANI